MDNSSSGTATKQSIKQQTKAAKWLSNIDWRMLFGVQSRGASIFLGSTLSLCIVLHFFNSWKTRRLSIYHEAKIAIAEVAGNNITTHLNTFLLLLLSKKPKPSLSLFTLQNKRN